MGRELTKRGRLLARGRTSDVYEYGADAVLKVSRPDVPDHWPAMEARFTAAIHGAGAPAPAVHEVVSIDGRDAIIMERVRGPSMWDLMLSEPHRAGALGRQLAGIHRDVHRAVVPAEISDLVSRVRVKIDDAVELSRDDRDQALQMLAALPERRLLCHGDFHPGNVLITANGPTIIDWFDAAAGNRTADVIRTALLVRPTQALVAVRAHLTGATAAILEMVHLEYLRSMVDADWIDLTDVFRWEAVLAASRLSERAEEDDSDLRRVWESRREGRESGDTALAVAFSRLGATP